MRALIQRVSSARVLIRERLHSEIGPGLLILLGVERGDTDGDALTLAKKIVDLRVLEDENGRMNRSIKEVSGSLLVVSQFTLLGQCMRGRRPSFDRAAEPEVARELYKRFAEALDAAGVAVRTGVFREMMDVELTNRGPVTLMLDTRERH
jgi:D-tyrosyl-tRNA(Tyr) deacylase